MPGIEEDLAVQIGETLISRKSMAEDAGLGGAGHWILNTGDGALLLVEVGNLALAIWTELEVNHHKLVNAISAKNHGTNRYRGGPGQKLPSGFVLRGKKWNRCDYIDATDSNGEKVTGPSQCEKSENFNSAHHFKWSALRPLGSRGPQF